MTATTGVDLPQRFADQMGRLLGPDFPPVLGVAVSGGGDSMAMLALTVPWARTMGISLRVVTVDHGLRKASASEAQMVAEECALLNVAHTVLRWQDWDGRGNTQKEARDARRALISEWRGDVQHVLFAHTQDDQAETVLMRLARGSGVEGLAGMAAQTDTPQGWQIVRPLLETTRAELRHFITVLRVPFVDDPSNADPRYARVRARAALAEMDALGVTQARLASTATAMQAAQTALAARTRDVAALCVETGFGHLQIDRDAFAKIEPDTQHRLMACALQWTAHAPYRPRLDALSRSVADAQSGKSSTLHGCQIIVGKSHLHVVRELNAVADLRRPADQLWDTSWRAADGTQTVGRYIAVLGQNGLGQMIRPDKIPASALYSLPALWEDGRVLAAPGLKSAQTRPEIALFRTPIWQDHIHSGIWR